jgi:hypothetical protein
MTSTYYAWMHAKTSSWSSVQTSLCCSGVGLIERAFLTPASVFFLSFTSSSLFDRRGATLLVLYNIPVSTLNISIFSASLFDLWGCCVSVSNGAGMLSSRARGVRGGK